MEYQLCRHVMTNGVQCQSPALRSGEHCFFHTRLYQRHIPFREQVKTEGVQVPGQHIQLTPLEDRDSIQVSLSLVVNALATGKLETRRAMAILYGLALASQNAARLSPPYGPKVVRTVTTSPEGLDLAAPGTTREFAEFSRAPFDEAEYEGDE